MVNVPEKLKKSVAVKVSKSYLIVTINISKTRKITKISNIRKTKKKSKICYAKI